MKKTIRLGIAGCFYVHIIFAAAPHNVINTEEGLESPITTLTAETLTKNGWSFSQRTEYYKTAPLSNATLLESPNFESQTALMINDLLIAYGVANDVTFGINFSLQNSNPLYASQPTDDTSSAAVTNLGRPSGFADTSFFGLWSITRANKHNFNIATSTMFGISAPTGKTNVKTTQGSLFAASDQPGAGAFLFFAGMIFSKSFGELEVSSNVIYTQTTAGDQDTTLGSYFDYNLAGVYPIINEGHIKKLTYGIDGVLELNGEYMAKDNISGFLDPNSGGNTVLLTPGIRLNIGKSISSYLGIGLPILQTLYGTQSKNTYILYAGVDLLF